MSDVHKALVGTTCVAGLGLASWRWYFPYLGDDIYMIRVHRKVAKIMMNAPPDRKIVDAFEEAVAKTPNKTFIIFEDRYYTYQFVNDMANKVANVASKWGLSPSDAVACMIYNEPAFVWTLLGLQKLGIPVAFVNFHLKATPLLHSITASEAKVLIVGNGDELLSSIDEIKSELPSIPIYVSGKTQSELNDRYSSLDDILLTAEPVQWCKVVRKSVSPLDPLCYIYTSGTTGLPKPAVINHAKSIWLSKFFQAFDYTDKDIVYISTPLYHSAATCLGLFNTIDVGATILIGKKFAARHYFEDCSKHNVTIIQYIGEMCRYLLRTPPSEFDKKHKTRVAVGNGLRQDIWEEFKSRFNIPQIAEFFGATEGTTGTWNLFDKPGCIGRLSPLTKWFGPPRGVETYIIRHDPITNEPLRDKNGRCIISKPGEEGLFISGIPEYITTFYKGSKEMNEKKVIRNVFKDGDMYFNYGDVFYLDKHYYMYFRDRVGDTYRWKSENVSTREVSDILSKLKFVSDANVYGVTVPGEDGRAGMVALILKHGKTPSKQVLQEIYNTVKHELPSYARPLFLRFLPEQIITQTMKHRKVELVEEGFDPNKISDPLFVIDNIANTYVPLTLDNYSKALHSKL